MNIATCHLNDGLWSVVSGSEQTLRRRARLLEHSLYRCIRCRVHSENYCLQSKGSASHSLSQYNDPSFAALFAFCVFLLFYIYDHQMNFMLILAFNVVKVWHCSPKLWTVVHSFPHPWTFHATTHFCSRFFIVRVIFCYSATSTFKVISLQYLSSSTFVHLFQTILCFPWWLQFFSLLCCNHSPWIYHHRWL